MWHSPQNHIHQLILFLNIDKCYLITIWEQGAAPGRKSGDLSRGRGRRARHGGGTRKECRKWRSLELGKGGQRARSCGGKEERRGVKQFVVGGHVWGRSLADLR